MSDPIPVTLSGNSTPLMPTEGLQMDLCSQCGVRPMHGPSSLLCASCELTSLRARLAEAEARAGRAEEAVRVLGEALVARRKFNRTKTGIEVHLNGVKCLGCGCVTFDVYGDEEPFPWEKVGHYAECPRLCVQATEQAVEQNPAARAAVEGAQ